MPSLSEPEAASLTVGGHRKQALGGAGGQAWLVEWTLGWEPHSLCLCPDKPAHSVADREQGARVGKRHLLSYVFKV